MICCLSPEMLLEPTGLGSTFSIGILPIVRVARRPFMANWRGAPRVGPLICFSLSVVYNQKIHVSQQVFQIPTFCHGICGYLNVNFTLGFYTEIYTNSSKKLNKQIHT
jgi:hypothetical protein